MSLQLSVTARNDILDQFEDTIGASPHLFFYTGAVPANCAASDPSGNVADLSLPSDWMAAASSGSKAKSGTWSGIIFGAGTIASWRLKSSGGTTHAQGTVTSTGGGGDITLDNPAVLSGQTLLMNTFTISIGNS